MSHKLLIGIDLGTTYTACTVGSILENGELHRKRLAIRQLYAHPHGSSPFESKELLPSVVWFTEDGLVFTGDYCKYVYPENIRTRVIRSIKRQMGNPNWIIKVESKIYRPRHIAAIILRTIFLTLREAYPSQDIESVTITIPASFSSRMRVETIEAAKLSGFGIGHLYLLDEPVAAIFSQWNSDSGRFGQIPDDSNLLVFDMGGGTLDASVINLSTKDHLIRVLSTSRYNELAGNDIDLEIASLMLHKVWQGLGYGSLADFMVGEDINPENRLAFTFKMMEHAEDVKVQLSSSLKKGSSWPLRYKLDEYCSTNESMRVRIMPPLKFRSQTIDYLEIPIHEVLQIVEPLISFQLQYRGKEKRNIFNPIDQALERAGLQRNDIAAVCITGGSSYFKPVTDEVFSYFNTKKQVLLDAFFAVADGAVNWTYLRRSKDWTIKEVFGDRIFLKREGLPFLEILNNLTIPSSAVERTFDDEICFSISQKSRGATLEFFQGDSPEDPLMTCTHIEHQIFPRALRGDVRLRKVIGRIDENKVFHFEMVFQDEMGEVNANLEFEMDSGEPFISASEPILSGITLNGEPL